MSGSGLAEKNESNCHTWQSTDTVCCPAARMALGLPPDEEITIARAHSDYHSFGGEIPEELSVGLKMTDREAKPYPPEIYVHYDNRVTCDICGHKCLPG